MAGAKSQHIQVYCRVRPQPKPSPLIAVDPLDRTVTIRKETGSGKTFTITGGPERYVDRGMIPRTISFLFSEFSKRTDHLFSLYVSYLEIYKDGGYDLLDPSHETKTLEDLPRVTMFEDEEGRLHLRNLSRHLARNEEEALNLLFLGDTNRTIAETPMNMASSRSHCIFTLFIEARQPDSDIIRRSKLHLVDLAGSERVFKSYGNEKVDERIFREAAYINSSLSFLELVIVTLSKRAQGKDVGHVPYRNSMMTSVLRDSLGGNGRTSMIATISYDSDNVLESISTCKFAQRVAMIQNKLEVNEEVDPKLVIRRLKREITELKEELAQYKGDTVNSSALNSDELHRVRELVHEFIRDDSKEEIGIAAPHKVNAAFAHVRELLRAQKTEETASERGRPLPQEGNRLDQYQKPSPRTSESDAAVKRLRIQLQQRDNEINILVRMLKRKRDGVDMVTQTASSAHDAFAERASIADGNAILRSSNASKSDDAPTTSTDVANRTETELLLDRNKAFEHFRKSYRKNEAINENKMILKEKYAAAKALGETIAGARERINALKALIEQRRVSRAVQSLSTEKMHERGEGDDPEESRSRALLEKERRKYKEDFQKLRALKGEIEHLQLILEQSRIKLGRDFEAWFSIMRSEAGVRMPAAPAKAETDDDLALPKKEDPESEEGRIGTSTDTGGGEAVPPRPRAAWGDATHDGSSAPPGAARAPARQPPLTGNADADADIIAFYRAREELLRKKRANQSHRDERASG